MTLCQDDSQRLKEQNKQMNEFARLRQEAGLSIPETVEALGYCERTIYRWESGDGVPRKAVLEVLRRTIEAKPQRRTGSFTFIDLFAGIGGLRRGFEPAGGRCVFTSEWDKYSVKTYLANHTCDHDVVGDITKIPAASIPAHDLLLAGFPCQPFSIAGVSKKNALGRLHGFRCDAQGTLFFDVARIIEHHRPKAFVLENVKNLLSHDRGRTFEVIRHALEVELGYQVQFRTIDAKGFVPQHRERIFIVGFREKNDFDFKALDIPDPQSGPRLGAILHPEDGSEEPDSRYTEGPRARVSEKYTLSDHLWGYLQDYADKHRAKGNGFGFGLVGRGDVARTLSARYFKDGSEILIRQRGKANPRRLTPRECARLMGFESPRGSSFVIPVSDTQAYRQFGNAVVVPVVEAVARHMAPHLLAEQPATMAAEKERAVA
jgi:DNA (cytosine-5)-methyltransferase 1